MPQILGLALLFLFIIAYVWISALNRKTPVPASCQQAYEEAQNCETCAVSGSCTIKDTINEIKEIKL